MDAAAGKKQLSQEEEEGDVDEKDDDDEDDDGVEAGDEVAVTERSYHTVEAHYCVTVTACTIIPCTVISSAEPRLNCHVPRAGP